MEQNGTHEPLADGTYVRICYTWNGTKKTTFVMVRNGGIFWKPPKGVTSVYFRANDATRDGVVAVDGRIVRLVPFSETESPQDRIEVSGPIQATVQRHKPAHDLLGFDYQLLKADTVSLKLVPEPDTSLETLRKVILTQKAKSIQTGKPVQDHHKCACPLVWHLFHKKHKVSF